MYTYSDTMVVVSNAAYDGNGNILTLVNSSDGSTVASYEYSPFGECIKAQGSMALENKFRFSTKYTDDETGLIYYGYRYYDAKNGRWVSRDKIEENGGMNLYGFMENGPISWVDILGMIKCEHILLIGHCSGNLDEDVGRRLEIWRDAKLVEKGVCIHSTASAIGCCACSWMGPKQDILNDERTKDTSEMDDSYAGNTKLAWGKDGNRGYNKPYFPDNPDKKMSDSESRKAAHKGFYDLVMNDWKATQKAADEHAKDCACKCDGGRVYAILRVIDEAAKRTYNSLRNTPKGMLPELDANGEVKLSRICKKGKK